MKKLILLLLVIYIYQPETFAQTDSTLQRKYQEFKDLEIKQMESENVLLESLFMCIFKKEGTGRDVANKYIDFARDAIKRWDVVLENPDVLFTEMTTLEIVGLVKRHTREDQDAEKRIEELKEKLRVQIREHIQKLSEDIRELSG